MKKNFVLIIVMLMTSSFFAGINIQKAGGVINNSSTLVENDVDLPVWNLMDKWVYDVQISAEQTQYFTMDFNLNINNLEFQVVEIQNNLDLYKLKMTVPQGGLYGSGNVVLDIFSLSGNIMNGKLDGFMYVKKSTLQINKCEGTIEGDTNKVLLPHFKVGFKLEPEEVVGDELVKTNFSSIKFPMNLDEIFTVSFYYLNMSINAQQPNLGQSHMYTYINEHEKKCEDWDILTVGSKEYDSLKISGVDYGTSTNIWFSQAAGNIVKIDYKNLQLGSGYLVRTFTMDLKSTTFQADSDAPKTPSKPSGGTDFLAGETGTYQTSTTDPDGNKIRYIFDWDDGTSKTYTGFVNSGEIVEVEHLWGKGGSHEVKVKARDKYGLESSWSDPLTVNVINNAPGKPSKPNGPSSGSYKDTHTYSTSSSDPDNHKIRYGWDWNGDNSVDQWTDLYNSGQTVSTSHKWSSKGTYNIKVKAQDEYGEESEWSDPLPVNIPKTSTHKSLIYQFIIKLENKYPFIEQLLKKLFT